MSSEVKKGHIVLHHDHTNPAMFSWNITRHTNQFPHVAIDLCFFDGYNRPTVLDFGLWNDDLNDRDAWSNYIGAIGELRDELDVLITSASEVYHTHFRELKDESTD